MTGPNYQTGAHHQGLLKLRLELHDLIMKIIANQAWLIEN